MKAPEPTLGASPSRDIEVNALAARKALEPIEVTLFGMVIEVSAVL